MKRRLLLGASTVLAAAAVPRLSFAQAYPAKAIRYIVPVPAGGGNDMIARVVTERWSRLLGQPFVIDASPNVLALHPSVPARTVQEFVDYAKRNPAKVNYASAGNGSLTHLTMELFKRDTGAFLVHIPYRGAAPAVTDLLGGQTQAMFPSVATALPHIRAGRLRALAVTGKKRSAQLPDVPTMEEAGFKGFDAVQWYGTLGPAGLPADIVRHLNETQVAVLKQPDLAEKLTSEAVEPWSMSPEEFGRYIRSEVARWSAVAKARGIHLDE